MTRFTRYMNPECPFCDIVANKIPSWIIFQDTNVICFLPMKLEAYGHTILASKKHYVDIYSMPEILLKAICVTAKKISLHYKKRLGSSGINILHASGPAAQQSVFHFHTHLIPRFDNDGLDLWPNLNPRMYDKDELLKKLKV